MIIRRATWVFVLLYTLAGRKHHTAMFAFATACSRVPGPSGNLDIEIQMKLFDLAATAVTNLKIPSEPEELSPDIFRQSEYLRQYCQIIQVIDEKIFVLQHSASLGLSWNVTCCRSNPLMCEAEFSGKSLREIKRILRATGRANVLTGNATTTSHVALRMLSMLRLLHQVLSSHPEHWKGRSFEFVHCTADGQPHRLSRRHVVVQPHTCKDAPVIAWPDWSPHAHPDLSRWKATLAAWRVRNDLHTLNFTTKIAKAVFRGRASGIKRTCMREAATAPTSLNWTHDGTRLKLLWLRQKRPELLDVGFTEPLAALEDEYSISLQGLQLDVREWPYWTRPAWRAFRWHCFRHRHPCVHNLASTDTPTVTPRRAHPDSHTPTHVHQHVCNQHVMPELVRKCGKRLVVEWSQWVGTNGGVPTR
eukprot:m.1049675 g.1049675  ORF g.1049675 m.1049675 type:complete len:418 (-) comp24174_c1_seq19:3082-4335(-)